jgi:hypothetical protein
MSFPSSIVNGYQMITPKTTDSKNHHLNNLYTVNSFGGYTTKNQVDSSMPQKKFTKHTNKIYVNCPDGQAIGTVGQTQQSISNLSSIQHGKLPHDAIITNTGICATSRGACGADINKGTFDDNENQYKCNYDYDNNLGTVGNYSDGKTYYHYNNPVGNTLSLDNNNPNTTAPIWLESSPPPTKFINSSECRDWCDKNEECKGVQTFHTSDGNLNCNYYNDQILDSNNNNTFKMSNTQNYTGYNTYIKNTNYSVNDSESAAGGTTSGYESRVGINTINFDANSDSPDESHPLYGKLIEHFYTENNTRLYGFQIAFDLDLSGKIDKSKVHGKYSSSTRPDQYIRQRNGEIYFDRRGTWGKRQPDGSLKPGLHYANKWDADQYDKMTKTYTKRGWTVYRTYASDSPYADAIAGGTDSYIDSIVNVHGSNTALGYKEISHQVSVTEGFQTKRNCGMCVLLAIIIGVFFYNNKK